MNFRDQLLKCDNCSKTFFFTVTEQRRLHQMGQEVEPPTLCEDCRVSDPETGRMVGRVKWFSPVKGYGFITKPSGDEIFFHRSEVAEASLDALDDGTPVVFNQVAGDRGPEAKQVEIKTS